MTTAAAERVYSIVTGDADLVDAASLYLNTKRALAGLEQALSAAKERLVRLAEVGDEPVRVNTPDGKAVLLVPAERRNFNVDELATILTADAFGRVTTTKVDHKAWDAAEKVGLIALSDEQAERVITKTPYVRVLEG